MNTAGTLMRMGKAKAGWLLRGITGNRKQYGARLKQFQGIHRGERCFIVATGPSLTLEDVEKLKGEVTFGVNSIVGFFGQTDWRPTYYTVIDALSYQKLEKKKLKDLKTVFYNPVIPYPYENGYKIPMYTGIQASHDTKLQQRFPKLFPWTKFSTDIARIVYDGRTVVYACLQIAVYMGFTEIYLLGTDCNYKGKKLYQDMLSYMPQNFDRDAGRYMIKCYEAAGAFQEHHEVTIWNATRGGELEVFERVDLDEVLSRSDRRSYDAKAGKLDP